VAGDVVSAGRKLAGAAQRRTRDGLLHQGSIVGQVGLRCLVAGFERVLGMGFEEGKPGELECGLAGVLVSDKYNQAAWNERVT
jgi:lipoate-protein ligase A